MRMGLAVLSLRFLSQPFAGSKELSFSRLVSSLKCPQGDLSRVSPPPANSREPGSEERGSSKPSSKVLVASNFPTLFITTPSALNRQQQFIRTF